MKQFRIVKLLVLTTLLFIQKLAASDCFADQKFPKVFQAAAGGEANNQYGAIAESSTISPTIYVGGSATQTALGGVLTGASLIGRIDLQTNTFDWHKMYQSGGESVRYVTALAVNPAGTQVAAHGTMNPLTTWVDDQKRAEQGNSFSYLFAVDAVTGEMIGASMFINHVSSYRVWSQGLEFRNDKIYVAFNSQESSYIYEGKHRIGMYNTATEILDFYYEQTGLSGTMYGRSASMTWRTDTDGFYVGGNTDVLKANQIKLSIMMFSEFGDLEGNYLLGFDGQGVALNGGGGHYGSYYFQKENEAPYIDHLHLDGDKLFGTTGHTNNHSQDKSGKFPLFFSISINTDDGTLFANTVTMREFDSGPLEVKSYIVGVKPDFSNEHMHVLWMRMKNDGGKGLYYLYTDMSTGSFSSSLTSSRAYKVAIGMHYETAVWIGSAQTQTYKPSCEHTENGAQNSGGWGCNPYPSTISVCGGSRDDDDFFSNDMCCGCGGGSVTVGTGNDFMLHQSYAVGSTTDTNVVGGATWDFTSSFESAVVTAIIKDQKCDSVHDYGLNDFDFIEVQSYNIPSDCTEGSISNQFSTPTTGSSNLEILSVTYADLHNLVDDKDCSSPDPVVIASVNPFTPAAECYLYGAPNSYDFSFPTAFNPSNCDAPDSQWVLFVSPLDISNQIDTTAGADDVYVYVDNSVPQVIWGTSELSPGIYPGITATTSAGTFTYGVFGTLPGSSTYQLGTITLEIDTCASSTTFIPPTTETQSYLRGDPTDSYTAGSFTPSHVGCSLTYVATIARQDGDPTPFAGTFVSVDGLTANWSTSDIADMTTWTITISATSSGCDNATVLSTVTYDLEVTNPCLTATLIIDQADTIFTFPSIVQYLGQPQSDLTWTDADITPSITGCGLYTYLLQPVIGTLDAIFLTPDSYTLSVVQTMDPLKVQTWGFQITVAFADPNYSFSDAQKFFQIDVLAACEPTSIIINPLTDLTYYVGTPSITTVPFDTFFIPTPSYCPVYFTETVTPSAAAVIGTHNLQYEYTVSSTDPLEVITVYTITLVAFSFASDTNMGFENFTVDVKDSCVDSTFTIPTSIFATYPLESEVGFPIQSQTFPESQVTTANVHFGVDIASLEAICGTALEFQGVKAGELPLDYLSGTPGQSDYTMMRFTQRSPEDDILEFECLDYSLVGVTIGLLGNEMYIRVGYPSYPYAGEVPFQVIYTDPCLTPVSFTAGAQTNPPNYAYTGTSPSASFSLNPVFVSDPPGCEQFATYTCLHTNLVINDMCALGALITFDSATGDYEFIGTDLFVYLPGTYSFQITGTLNDQVGQVTFDLVLVDNCQGSTLSINAPSTFVDATHELSDSNNNELRYAWQPSAIATLSVNNCGAFKIEFSANTQVITTGVIFNGIFEDIQTPPGSEEFIVLQTNDPSLLQVWDITYVISLVDYPAVTVSSVGVENFQITVVDPCATATLTINKPPTFVDATYILRDPMISYSWSQSAISTLSVTTYDCGNTLYEFYADGTAIPYGVIYELFLDEQDGASNENFNILYSEVALEQVWAITYTISLVDYPLVSVTSDASQLFTVTVLDPCKTPQLTFVPVTITNRSYTLMQVSFDEDIETFTISSDWCESFYDYSVSDPNADNVITSAWTPEDPLGSENPPNQPNFVYHCDFDLENMIANKVLGIVYTITMTGESDTITDTSDFMLTVKNPCFDDDITKVNTPVSQSLDPTYSVTYYIGQGEITLSSAFKSAFTQTVDYCGGLSFTYYAVNVDALAQVYQIGDANSDLFDVVYTTNDQIKINTNDFAHLGAHTFQIQANYTDYDDIKSLHLDMTVRFERCTVSNMEISDISTITIQPDGAETVLEVEEWIVHGAELCNYHWDYTAFYKGQLVQNSPIAEYVQFDAQNRTFTFATTVADKSYNISLVGDLSDEYSYAFANFTLVVEPAPINGNFNTNQAPFISVRETYEIQRRVDGDGIPFQTEATDIFLGEIVDNEGDEFISSLKSSTESELFTFDHELSLLYVASELKNGTYELTLTLQDFNEQSSAKRSFKFNVVIIDFRLADIEFDEVVNLGEAPTMQIESISNVGKVEISFSQEMNIISNLTNINSTNLHLELKQVDLDNDFSMLNFTWNVTSFSSNKMTIQMYFENPIYISSSTQRDMLQLTVLEAIQFRSKESNQMAEEEVIMQKSIPTQFPLNSATEALGSAVNVLDNAGKGALISNLIVNVMISGALNLLWGMINSLQIIAHFPLVNVIMPANCQLVFSFIIKIATFDVVDVSTIMDWIDEIFPSESDEDIVMNDNFQAFDYESTNPIQNLEIVFLFFTGLCVLPILIKTVQYFSQCSEVLTRHIINLKKKIYWNFYLRFFLEAFLELSIASMIRLHSFQFSNTFDSILTSYAMVILMILVSLMVGSVFFLLKRFNSIREKDFKDMYGALSLGLQFREKTAMYYPFMFMFRRLVYAMIFAFLSDFNYFQVQLVVFKTSMFMAFQGQVKPFYSPFQNKLDLFNETCTVIATYGLIVFTKFVPNAEARYQCGWFLIGITFLILCTNIFCLFRESATDGIRKAKMKNSKDTYMKQIKNRQQEKERLETLEANERMNDLSNEFGTLSRSATQANLSIKHKAKHQNDLLTGKHSSKLKQNRRQSLKLQKRAKPKYVLHNISEEKEPKYVLHNISEEESKLELSNHRNSDHITGVNSQNRLNEEEKQQLDKLSSINESTYERNVEALATVLLMQNHQFPDEIAINQTPSHLIEACMIPTRKARTQGTQKQIAPSAASWTQKRFE